MDNGMIQIILAVIALLGTIVTAVVAPYVKSKYTEAKRNEIYRYAEIAVLAAEQIFKIQDPDGSKRKQYVIDFLNSKGFKLNPQELDIIIEAAVRELNFITQEIKN